MTNISNKSVENPITYRTLQSYLDDKGLILDDNVYQDEDSLSLKLLNADYKVVECCATTFPLSSALNNKSVLSPDLINSLLILDLYTHTGQLYHIIAFDYEFNTVDVKHLF